MTPKETRQERDERIMGYLKNLHAWGFGSNGVPMFGKAIRALREEAGFGLRETAIKLGLTATQLSKFERGEVHKEHVAPPMTKEEWKELEKKLDAIRNGQP